MDRTKIKRGKKSILRANLVRRKLRELLAIDEAVVGQLLVTAITPSPKLRFFLRNEAGIELVCENGKLTTMDVINYLVQEKGNPWRVLFFKNSLQGQSRVMTYHIDEFPEGRSIAWSRAPLPDLNQLSVQNAKDINSRTKSQKNSRPGGLGAQRISKAHLGPGRGTKNSRRGT